MSSLYRKYRPKTFDEIVEQQHVVETLRNQIKSNNIAHAYLFTGTRGTGKTTCAKIFAKAVNCLHPVNGSPCLNCEVCKALENANNMDVIEIDAASNNSVEDIRDMRENIKFAPVDGRYKVYIIDEVHMLSPSAFNALLKSIEEPPKHIIFILATTEVHKIPATILSRVVRLDFRLIGVESLKNHLENLFKKENVKIEDSASSEIARLGEGSVRDMLSIAECVRAYANDNITYDDVLTCMGISSRDFCKELVLNILEKNSTKFFENVDEQYKQGKNFALLSKEIVTYLRDMLICKTCEHPKKILNLPDKDFVSIKEIADKFVENDIFVVMGIFVSAENEFRYASNPRILFESLGVLAMSDDEVKKKIALAKIT